MWRDVLPIIALVGLFVFERWWMRRQRTHPSERWSVRRKAMKDRFSREERELYLDELRRKSAEIKAREKSE